MASHPRIKYPSKLLPPGIDEVLLAPARGGYTALCLFRGSKQPVRSIPLIGCRTDCESVLAEALVREHGFASDSALRVAQRLFAALDPEEPEALSTITREPV